MRLPGSRHALFPPTEPDAMLSIGIIAVLSYLIGSIPTAIIVAKRVRGIDIRQHGSGTRGAQT
jgi:glycerol-3-phosphate acyltransferase PlsY